MDELTKELLIEREFSLLSPEIRGDKQRLNELIHPDFIEFSSSGLAYGKAEVLAALPDEKDIKITAKNFNVRILDKRLAQVTFESTTHASGHDKKALRSSLWKEEDGEWRMIFHQGTVL